MTNSIQEIEKTIRFFIDNLDIPKSIKDSLFGIASELKTKEELSGFLDSLEKGYINQGLVKTDPQYIAEMEKLDKETLSELDKIFN